MSLILIFIFSLLIIYFIYFYKKYENFYSKDRYIKKTKRVPHIDLKKFIRKSSLKSCPSIPDPNKYILKSKLKPKNKKIPINLLSIKKLNKNLC